MLCTSGGRGSSPGALKPTNQDANIKEVDYMHHACQLHGTTVLVRNANLWDSQPLMQRSHEVLARIAKSPNMSGRSLDLSYKDLMNCWQG
eukprot:scaffold261_cov318-Chaetoceros_neogracile.AAC.5